MTDEEKEYQQNLSMLIIKNGDLEQLFSDWSNRKVALSDLEVNTLGKWLSCRYDNFEIGVDDERRWATLTIDLGDDDE